MRPWESRARLGDDKAICAVRMLPIFVHSETCLYRCCSEILYTRKIILARRLTNTMAGLSSLTNYIPMKPRTDAADSVCEMSLPSGKFQMSEHTTKSLGNC